MNGRPRVAVIGYGAVGRAMTELFPDAVLYDPPQGMDDREAVNDCQFAFVCVPTPPLPDGQCDTSIVEEAVSWITSGTIIIRSTVPPGTTDTLSHRYGKRVVFQPEYGPGGTPDHPFQHARAVSWVIVGGPRAWTAPVCDLYAQVLNAELRVQQTDAVTAELTKYMENAFLAVKVAFCNEFFDIATRLGVDYHTLRELWLLDPRMGRSHTWVHPDARGFGGACLPKDLRAIVQVAAGLDYAPTLLAATLQSNAAVQLPSGHADAGADQHQPSDESR